MRSLGGPDSRTGPSANDGWEKIWNFYGPLRLPAPARSPSPPTQPAN